MSFSSYIYLSYNYWINVLIFPSAKKKKEIWIRDKARFQKTIDVIKKKALQKDFYFFCFNTFPFFMHILFMHPPSIFFLTPFIRYESHRDFAYRAINFSFYYF